MKKSAKIGLSLGLVLLVGGFTFFGLYKAGKLGSLIKGNELYCEVWSQNGPDGASFEFKVNDFTEYDDLKQGYLWECEEVIVETPEGKNYSLNKDYNINIYSGEVTRRWVLYGPANAGLPSSGTYKFYFIHNGSVDLIKTVEYEQNNISYPKEIQWNRDQNDLEVNWNAPEGDKSEVWYKVLVFGETNASFFISQQFDDGSVESATLKDVPLTVGHNYSLNVAIYYSGGYAYSEYIPFEWPSL